MKRLCLSLAAFLLFSASASADVLDFEKITCGQLISQKADLISLMWFWMDGQVHGAKDSTVIDRDHIADHINALGAECKKRPNDPALSVYEDLNK